jgi:FkbM family methyltransferase
MWFVIARIYSRLYGFLKDRFGIRIRGLGCILRNVREDHLLLVKGRALYFSHELAAAYIRPLHGEWSEPETHKLIEYVMHHLDIVFVDVGANIGEILIDIATHPSCVKAVAFEPNPTAIRVINLNILLNSLNNCIVKNLALGHLKKTEKMFFGSHSPTASLLSIESSADYGVDIEISTLDLEIDFATLKASHVVLLIDVEGYELNVISGGSNLISSLLPLIIFEYHQETKKIFSLDALQCELGDSYQIFRVRQDAMLDGDVKNAWNCVAIPRNTQFESILRSRIIS